ncbi:epoxyqueuosine reductase QueH [Persephonella sp.]
MKKLLVHLCCGVDAVYALRKLREEFPGVHMEGYFYDPNIHPEEEYKLRWIETERICNQLDIECHLADYELDSWLSAVKGYEDEPERGERCTLCHDLRLEKTARFAVEHGFDSFTTVLMMSPKKDFDVLKSVGESIAEKYGLKFVAVDFRKNGGVEKMNRMSKEAQLYHQNYCGCMYALFQQRDGEIIKELVSFGKGRLPGSREELLFIKEVRKFAEEIGLPCNEETFGFVNWRVVSSYLSFNKKPVKHGVLWFSRSIRGILRARVEQVIEEEDRRILKLNKQNASIVAVEGDSTELKLDVPRLYTDPIFIIRRSDLPADLEKVKVEAKLKTDFDPEGRSQNLIIGKKDALFWMEFYSDTLADGSGGFDIKEIKNILLLNRERIVEGEMGVIVYGADTVGRLGRRHQEEFILNI